MAHETIEIFAPNRLHFGMFSFGHENVRQFGGVGCMIATPGMRLRARGADVFAASGPLAERVAFYAARVGRAWGLDGPPPASIEMLSAPGAHLGLGVGTQLALTVAAALASLANRPIASVAELVGWVGRGERSAVGAHGWRHGGLIVEGGTLFRENRDASALGLARSQGAPLSGAQGERLSPLVARHPLPDAWRFVLVRPLGLEGLSGEAERQAFAALAPTPAEFTDALCRIALLGLAPAAVEGDFAGFSEALFDYGRLAGRCFATGGAQCFSSQRLERLVYRIRELGGVGVGQSSWGPTLFVAAASQGAAEELCAKIRREAPATEIELLIAAVDNAGARMTGAPAPQPSQDGIRRPEAADEIAS